MFPLCNLFKVHYNTCQGYVDKKKEKKMSSMNKSCEKTNSTVKIFYMWMFV